jgi:cytochrome P450
MVLAMIGSANRDPKHFPNADRFDLRREPNPHIAFGHGVHFCLGAALARLEARVALAALLKRPRWSLADDAPWPPRVGLQVLGPRALPFRF